MSTTTSKTALLAGLAVVTCAGTVISQERAAVERGAAKFEHTCAPCHAAGIGDDGRAMLPGTDALRIKYRGAVPELLEKRTDLTADALRAFIRFGTWSMPPFRPTEVSERDIQDIAAYLKSTAAASTAQ
jgi:mono/diheme cytochrome c family protein